MTKTVSAERLVSDLRDVISWLLNSRIVGYELKAVHSAELIKRAVDELSRHQEPVNEPGEAEPTWRDLALQFDGHRIECLSMLRYAVRWTEEYATVRDILREPLASLKTFLAAPPLPGEAVLAARIQALRAASTPKEPDHIPDAGKMVGAQASTSEGEALPERCPHCSLHWGYNPPAIVARTDQVRCIECKTLYAAPQPTSVSPLPVGVVAWRREADGWLNKQKTGEPLVRASQAHSTIAALRAERDRLTAELTNCGSALAKEVEDRLTAEAEVKRLTEEREALRGQTYLASAEAAEFHRDNAVSMWHDEKVKRETAEARIKTLEGALNEIRELNMSGEDENGHRWANSDMIEQTIVFALAAARKAMEGGE